jgi:SAM-dependent methyltransferase
VTKNRTTKYAFPHSGADERRRLELFADRLDPLTVRRISLLTLPAGAHCLEIGGGRGSIARWLCEYVGAAGHVTATDLQTGFLSELSLPNLSVLRHDVRTDEFPAGSFDLIHVRAVLMHIADWAFPGGSLSQGRVRSTTWDWLVSVPTPSSTSCSRALR